MILELTNQCARGGIQIPPAIIAACLPDTGQVTLQNATRTSANFGEIAALDKEAAPQGSLPSITVGDHFSDEIKVRLEAARSYIHCEYFCDVDSKTLARIAGMSRYHFIRSFSSAYGISPHQYLLKTRLDAAKRLLTLSTETIDVVAAASGFRSGACLNRAFTRMEGSCVSTYCRVIKKNQAARAPIP